MHMLHHFLNLQPQKSNRGSPNNSAYNLPDVYERPVHSGNRSLLFSSGNIMDKSKFDLIYP